MNAGESTKPISNNVLNQYLASITDEALVAEFLFTEQNLPKGLMLMDDQRHRWKVLQLTKFAIMSELSRRFNNA